MQCPRRVNEVLADCVWASTRVYQTPCGGHFLQSHFNVEIRLVAGFCKQLCCFCGRLQVVPLVLTILSLVSATAC